MERDEINKIAETALNDAEKGDKAALANELNKIPFGQRREIVAQMQELSEQHHQKNSDLPQLEFTSVKADDGDHVASINMKTERSYLNPARWFGDKYAREEVYSPPGSELGTGMLMTAVDTIRSHNAQLEELQKELDRH